MVELGAEEKIGRRRGRVRAACGVQPRRGALWRLWFLQKGRNMFKRRPYAIIAATLGLVAAASLMPGLVAVNSDGATPADQPFNPTRKRITFSADRTPVDIEVVGSTSLLPNTHRLLPELVLRLRLDRAYVYNFMAGQQPGFEILGISIDLDTGLPAGLFETVVLGPRFGHDIPGIPHLPAEELRRRHIALHIQSDDLAATLAKFRELALPCRGQPLGNDLWSYERSQKSDCPPVYSHEIKYIAALSETEWLEIDCDKTSPPSWSRCSTRFPFEGFAVELNFSQRLLPRWRELVTFAETFLNSKRYAGSVP
jgi:hypothetical protein